VSGVGWALVRVLGRRSWRVVFGDMVYERKGRFWLKRHLLTVHGVSMASIETFPRNYDTKDRWVSRNSTWRRVLPASGLGYHDNASFPIHRRTGRAVTCSFSQTVPKIAIASPPILHPHPLLA